MFTNWLTGTSGNSANSNEQVTTSGAPHLLATAPDVVLEVGPAPDTVRFMAHSLILGMHSGYLRSAVRLDDPTHNAANNLVIYLANVTAEQFAPLLTYMYTGYLDLNVENIFGVLLATHVLHMPRALEICRAFLARAQSDGYLSNNLNTNLVSPAILPANNASKIIRPIPSKATLPNYAYQSMALNLNTFKNQTEPTTYNNSSVSEINATENCSSSQNGEEIDVDRSSSRGSLMPEKTVERILEEDEEVFIDSNTTTDAEDVDIKVVQKSPHNLSDIKKSTTNKRRNKTKQREKCKKRTTKTVTNNLGLQVAKAPIPASQLEPIEGTKVIIDVASCDGPVRFRRILNTAYGHKPDAYVVAPERSQQSVSLSFHQQMARTIRQQTEESENKDALTKSKQNNSEIYVCVYCKHTFKSQYCYQKHAKRHLNPLSLSCARAAATTEAVDDESACDLAKTLPNVTVIEGSITKIPNTKTAAAELLKREVRPLDMNVQYYPCKTCGSKFPSYYFVHKHRKLCHAEEETETNQSLDASTDKNSTNQSDASKKST